MDKDTASKLIDQEARFINGLTEVITGIPNQFSGPAIAQTNSLFLNLRNYFVSNMRQPLSSAYCELGILKAAVDVPVDDAFRGGIDFTSKELSPEELEELHFTLEQEGDDLKLAEAKKWDRLYGGAGVLIMTDQDYEEPLDLEAIGMGDEIEFKAVDMWELFWDKQNVESFDPSQLGPRFEHYDYYGKRIHRSRVLIMKGVPAPSFLRPRLRGWGLSIAEILIRSINQYLKATDLTYQVLDEFKVDIYKIKDLNTTLGSGIGDEKIRRRIMLANYQKNYQNAITMDSEDDFGQKELSFQGIAETMLGIRMQVASDLRMPMSKLFGIASVGFSSGEDDIENYNAMVESTVRRDCKKHAIVMAKIRCQQLFGFIPEDLRVQYKPLRILSSEQEEAVKSSKFNRLLAARTAHEITSKEFKDACNKENLLVIQVDPNVDSLDEKTDEAEAMGNVTAEGETAEVETKAAGVSATAPKLAKG